MLAGANSPALDASQGRVFLGAGRLTSSARLPSTSDEDAAPMGELWMGEAEARGDEGRQGGEDTTRAMGRGGGDKFKGRRGEREGPTAMFGREGTMLWP